MKEGRGRKEEERKEWRGSIGRDAIPDCEPSETRRRENPDFPSNLLFKRVENSRFFCATEYKGMESGRKERKGEIFFSFSRASFSSSRSKSQIGKVFNRNLTNSSSIECQ